MIKELGPMLKQALRLRDKYEKSLSPQEIKDREQSAASAISNALKMTEGSVRNFSMTPYYDNLVNAYNLLPTNNPLREQCQLLMTAIKRWNEQIHDETISNSSAQNLAEYNADFLLDQVITAVEQVQNMNADRTLHYKDPLSAYNKLRTYTLLLPEQNTQRMNAEELLQQIEAWHQYISDNYSPGKPIDSNEPKNVAEFMQRQAAD